MRQPTSKNLRLLTGALSIGLATAVSGCSILGDGNEPSTEAVSTNEGIVASTVDGSSDPDQATSDSDSNATPSTLPTSSTTDPTASTTADTTAPSPPSDFCEANGRNNFDIVFEPGAVASTVTSTVPADEVDLYRIEVGQAQIMSVSLVAPKDNAVAGVMAPDGSVIPGRFLERTIAPTQAGVYLICVSPGDGGVSYELTVSVIDDNTPTKIAADWCGDDVNDRGAIRFQSGAVAGSVQDSVIRGERDHYSLIADEGQTIDVRMTSTEDNAVFDLRSPSGELLITEVSDFRIPLPESGSYLFCVGGTRGNATYSMVVTVE